MNDNQHPSVFIQASVDQLLAQDPRFDIVNYFWTSGGGEFHNWVLYPLPHPLSPQTDREIATIRHHDGYCRYELLDHQGAVLDTFLGSPLREPFECDCIGGAMKAIAKLWELREDLHARWLAR